ncbi:acyltransferase [bacterium]|nr:acyltransferase [bacterium]
MIEIRKNKSKESVINNSKLITFDKNGYDKSIDFIKGLCILAVVVTHCIPYVIHKYFLFCLWIDWQVALFLMIQTFHTYKKGIDIRFPKFQKLWKRIIKPFLFTEIIIFIGVILGGYIMKQDALSAIVKKFILSGGWGPGSYYHWIYLQMALLLPLIAPMFKKIKAKYFIWIFIAISEALEILCSVINMPEWLYRLLFFRYFFLIYFGYLIVMEELRINKKTIFLSVISVIAILLFQYANLNLEPFFFTTGWKIFHWISYFYVAYILLYLLKLLYVKMNRYTKVMEYIESMGKYSYEIFLFQMLYFALVSPIVNKLLTMVINKYIAVILFVAISIIVSIVPVVYYKTRRSQK